VLDQAIREALRRMAVDADEQQVSALVIHAEMLVEANKEQNLTRIVAPEDVALLHVADSLAALPHLLRSPMGRFADLGSGGGYPGIPLAIMTRRPLTLVESRGGKATFLSKVVDALGLDAEVRPARAEELALTDAGVFSAITARALAALPALVELAAPLLAPGGSLVAMKGEPEAAELQSGEKVAAMTGMAVRSVERVTLPGSEAKRTIIVVQKVGKPKVRLPRRPGMAQRHPLA
jgi:16S rRNA (guanine527-N7)-methyltransferase